MPCATLEQAFDAVTDGRASHAVVPVENAVSGTVPQVYELLLAHDLSSPARRRSTSITCWSRRTARRAARCARVMSHPIALAQCADFFRTNRGIEAVSVFDTAGAVRMAVEASDGRTAAIASRRAAALYGAAIIAEHIQDRPARTGRGSCCSRRRRTQTHVDRPAEGARRLRPEARARRPDSRAPAALPTTASASPRSRGGRSRHAVRLSLSGGNGRCPRAVRFAATPFQALKQATTWLKVLGAFRL